MRESGCTLAGSGGLNKVERGGFVPVDARRERRKPIEGAEGRQSSHLALKRRLRALFHSFFPPSSSSFSFVPSFSRLSHSILFDTLSLSLSLSLVPLLVSRSTLHAPTIPRPSSAAPLQHRATFFLSVSSSSCLPASLTPRGHSGHCTRNYLPAAFRPLPPSKVKVSSLREPKRERERERERENSSSDGETFAIWRPRDGAFLFTRFISASSVVPW